MQYFVRRNLAKNGTCCVWLPSKDRGWNQAEWASAVPNRAPCRSAAQIPNNQLFSWKPKISKALYYAVLLAVAFLIGTAGSDVNLHIPLETCEIDISQQLVLETSCSTIRRHAGKATQGSFLAGLGGGRSSCAYFCCSRGLRI